MEAMKMGKTPAVKVMAFAGTLKFHMLADALEQYIQNSEECEEGYAPGSVEAIKLQHARELQDHLMAARCALTE
jgi:hypothetical protein